MYHSNFTALNYCVNKATIDDGREKRTFSNLICKFSFRCVFVGEKLSTECCTEVFRHEPSKSTMQCWEVMTNEDKQFSMVESHHVSMSIVDNILFSEVYSIFQLIPFFLQENTVLLHSSKNCQWTNLQIKCWLQERFVFSTVQKKIFNNENMNNWRVKWRWVLCTSCVTSSDNDNSNSSSKRRGYLFCWRPHRTVSNEYVLNKSECESVCDV
jgi:hypothetical protein